MFSGRATKLLFSPRPRIWGGICCLARFVEESLTPRPPPPPRPPSPSLSSPAFNLLSPSPSTLSPFLLPQPFPPSFSWLHFLLYLYFILFSLSSLVLFPHTLPSPPSSSLLRFTPSSFYFLHSSPRS